MEPGQVKIIPPLSVVQITKVTSEEPAWKGRAGRLYRIGYYRKKDGLDCVWLVDEQGDYGGAVDQEMIRTHFKVVSVSDETDLFGVDRPEMGPLQDGARP